MVSASTKRKRRDRGNRVAAAVEDGRARSKAEHRALGTTVTPHAPNKALFVEDRKGKTKAILQHEHHEQAVEQRRAAKRAKRAAPKIRRSEAVLAPAEAAAVTKAATHGRKKKEGVGMVDVEILAKRKFDKPRGHAGNVSEVLRQGKMHTDGKEDVWMSDMLEKVKGETGLNRRRIAEKMNAVHRSAPSVIHPTDGLSINPTHVDHQDKLGEALARLVEGDDKEVWTENKMKYDLSLLMESREDEVADTGMKIDEREDQSDAESDEGANLVKGVPERKTRSQRHKESRKREMASNIKKKKVKARRHKDFRNIEEVALEAIRMADKLSGEEKRREQLENPAPEKPVDQPVVNRLAGQRVRNESTAEPIPLSTELSDSMRSVKMPVANPLLRDRFLSFERRGLIAPPKVLPKELWRMEQAKQQDLLRDKRKRKGRGSRSNLTFWRNGKRVIQ